MTLGLEQFLLPLDPAAIAAERAVAADHAVAWDEHADVIVAVGRPDRTHRLGRSDGCGDVGIAAGLAGRNLAQLAPDRLLEGRSGDVDREVGRSERPLYCGQRAF